MPYAEAVTDEFRQRQNNTNKQPRRQVESIKAFSMNFNPLLLTCFKF